MSNTQFEGAAAIGDEDCHAAADLIAGIWPDYVDLFRREMEIYRAHPDVFRPFFVLAKNEGKVAGFGLLTSSVMSTDLSAISWVAVHPCNRHCGIGRKLIDICLHEARQRTQSVVLTTTVPGFYSKIGFKIVDEYHVKEKSFLLTCDTHAK